MKRRPQSVENVKACAVTAGGQQFFGFGQFQFCDRGDTTSRTSSWFAVHFAKSGQHRQCGVRSASVTCVMERIRSYASSAEAEIGFS